jgi:hypothetical protein
VIYLWVKRMQRRWAGFTVGKRLAIFLAALYAAVALALLARTLDLIR